MTVPDGWQHFREQAYTRSKIELRPGSLMQSTNLILTGLTEETAEVMYLTATFNTPGSTHEKLVLELGDAIWHVALLEKLGDVYLDWSRYGRGDALSCLAALGEMSGAVKRALWGMEFPRERFISGMEHYVGNWLKICARYDIAPFTAMSENIAKNHRRFGPDGFNPAAAEAKADEA